MIVLMLSTNFCTIINRISRFIHLKFYILYFIARRIIDDNISCPILILIKEKKHTFGELSAACFHNCYLKPHDNILPWHFYHVPNNRSELLHIYPRKQKQNLAISRFRFNAEYFGTWTTGILPSPVCIAL